MGATLLTLIGVLGVVGWNSPENMGAEGSPEGIAYWVMTVVYAPLLLWGPLLAVVAIASFRIRTRTRRSGGPAPLPSAAQPARRRRPSGRPTTNRIDRPLAHPCAPGWRTATDRE
jgi:hypothetical protein